MCDGHSHQAYFLSSFFWGPSIINWHILTAWLWNFTQRWTSDKCRPSTGWWWTWPCSTSGKYNFASMKCLIPKCAPYSSAHVHYQTSHLRRLSDWNTFLYWLQSFHLGITMAPVSSISHVCPFSRSSVCDHHQHALHLNNKIYCTAVGLHSAKVLAPHCHFLSLLCS